MVYSTAMRWVLDSRPQSRPPSALLWLWARCLKGDNLPAHRSIPDALPPVLQAFAPLGGNRALQQQRQPSASRQPLHPADFGQPALQPGFTDHLKPAAECASEQELRKVG